LRGETRIIAELGAALFGQRSPVPWTEYAEDYTAVRQLIGKVVAGYRDAAGWGNARAGAVLPNPIRERRFGGSGGRARFAANPLPETDDRGQDALRLMTIRSHDQFNTCIQDANDRYRGLRGARRAVLLNPEDMRRLAISPTQRVWLRPVQTASTRTEEAFLAVPYPIPQGCAAAYFPEANRITDLDALDRSTGTPASKSVRISITPG
jgi:anaerobic selenocysteine-containing dehydrogenase